MYVAGHLEGSIDLGGGALAAAGSRDILLASFYADGGHRWSKSFGSSQADTGRDLVVDGTDLYISGQMGGAIDFGGGTRTTGATDAFIAAFSTLGAYRWDQVGTTPGWAMAGALSAAAGTLHGCFGFDSTLSIGGQVVPSLGSFDSFTRVYARDGSEQWSKQIGGPGDVSVQQAALDSDGTLFVTGYFSSAIDLGDGQRDSAGGNDVLLASYGSNGSLRWSRRFGGPEEDAGRAIAFGAGGDLIVAGEASSAIDFGRGPIDYAGGQDLFVARFDRDGGCLWSTGAGGSGDERVADVAVVGTTTIVAGSFDGRTELGTDVHTSEGGHAILLRLDP